MPAGAGLVTRGSLGLTNPEKAFDRFYQQFGLPKLSKKGEMVTPPMDQLLRDPVVQERFKGWAAAQLGAQAKVVEDNDVEGAREHLKQWVESKGDLLDAGARKAITGESKTATTMVQKATADSGVVGIPSADGAVPLVYDPEIIQIFKENTPILDALTTRGQQGFKAVANRISSRGGPIGAVSESDSADLTNNTASNTGYGQVEKEMEILVDLIEVTDFADMATEFQFSLRNSQLGSQLGNFAQLRERMTLYGDNSQGTGTGDIGDANAYDGVETDIEDNNSGNHIDKSSVNIDGTLGLIKDIKSEVKERLQSDRAVSPTDLFVGTSYTIQDHGENEMQNFVRIASQIDGVDVGGGEFRIHGVPVVESHNVDGHTDGSFTPGDEGDVFLMHRQSVEMRQLMPVSTVPLARHGFAEMVAIGTFEAPILRANGEFSKYLSAYPVTQLT